MKRHSANLVLRLRKEEGQRELYGSQQRRQGQPMTKAYERRSPICKENEKGAEASEMKLKVEVEGRTVASNEASG